MKGVHLEGLRVLGLPQNFAKTYYDEGADELLFVDIVASLYGRNSLTSLIEEVAKQIFIPLTVAGGLRSLEDMHRVLRAGADKVALNTAAVARPELITEAARAFGSSTIVVSIEVIERNGKFEVYTDNGRERTGRDALEWAREAVDRGAGELLVTSVDREGTGRGMHLELSRAIATSVPVPVIASGGVGNVEHVVDAALDAKVQAVAVASVLHYDHLQRFPNADGIASGHNTDHLKNAGFGRITSAPLADLHRAARARGVRCLARRSEASS